ncbi:MAG: aminotransferase class I/II-fold pyridoxal phosphate-dependent enzyme [Bacillota bacterium]|jgi:aspartate/methionine/tyrosine aminotransferase
MVSYQNMDNEQLQTLRADLQQKYDCLKAKKLKLNMSRGVPCPEQLALSGGLLTAVDQNSFQATDGTDCRNYGIVDGLPEAKALFAELLDVKPVEVIVGGNSSLALMHDIIVRALLLGVPGGAAPWGRAPVKFLCPSPGYDRHFAICQLFNIEMITIDMRSDGPDMDRVEALTATDASIKGIWCVPKYSNPTGITFSATVVERLARMQTRAADFRIFWDNSYAVHDLTANPDVLPNLLEACKAAGNPDRVFIFTSTAKISLAGGGLGVVASSETNIDWLRKLLTIQTIGPDKLNQLRHIRFFKDMAGIRAQMQRHAAIIKPKFDKVQEILGRELWGLGIASWTKPKGGYFISLDTLEGCAKNVVAMAADAGVVLTKAGATFPYGKDPKDRNIRIAPTLPSLVELETAMEILAVCIQLASVAKLLQK